MVLFGKLWQLQVVQHEDEEQAEDQRDDRAGGEDHDGVRQHGLLGREGGTAHAHDLVVLLGPDARLVLLLDEVRQDCARNLLLLLELLQAGIRGDDLLPDQRELVAELLAVLLEFSQLVLVRGEVAVRRRKRVGDGVDEVLANAFELLLLGLHRRVALRVLDQQGVHPHL